jgi:hypothetical protein
VSGAQCDGPINLNNTNRFGGYREFESEVGNWE